MHRAARYGGNEIAVIFPKTSAQGCLKGVRRLLTAVRSHPFTFEGQRIPLTISLGAAPFRPEMSITRFVGTADEAL